MISLQLPDIKYKETYLDAVREIHAKKSENDATDHYFTRSIDDLDTHFAEIIAEYGNKRKGINLPEGKVPRIQYWIIDENGTYCGRISLRPMLNDSLKEFGGNIGYDIIPSQRGKHYASQALRLCLIEAKKLGLTEVLLTCNDTNIPSIRTIESNHGILIDKIMRNNKLIRRYKILL